MSDYEVYSLLEEKHKTSSQMLMTTTRSGEFQDLYTVEYEVVSIISIEILGFF